MSQGYIGIDLQNVIKYELQENMDVKVSTILSQVEVDPEDAFKNPNGKPIGRFLIEEEARKNMENGFLHGRRGKGLPHVVASHAHENWSSRPLRRWWTPAILSLPAAEAVFSAVNDNGRLGSQRRH